MFSSIKKIALKIAYEVIGFYISIQGIQYRACLSLIIQTMTILIDVFDPI